MEAHGFQYKDVKHFERRHETHHLTFSCDGRRPLLDAEENKIILAETLSRAIERHGCALIAFVFMPEHVHLVVRPRGSEPVISRLLYSIKQPMSLRVRKRELRQDPTSHAVAKSDASSRSHVRFWQSGPGFDTNIRAWDHVLDAVQYVHLNPVRRGMARRPEEYRWSSCRQWMFPDEHVDPAFPRITRERE